MKKNLQTIGVILAIILIAYIGLAILNIASKIVFSSLGLFAIIVGLFIAHKKKKNDKESIKVINLIFFIFLIVGFFVYDMIGNLVFSLFILSVVLRYRKNKKFSFSPIDIIMLITLLVYLFTGGIPYTISKGISVFVILAIVTGIIWENLRIYFDTSANKVNEKGQIVFEDERKQGRFDDILGKVFNMNLLSKEFAVNLAFGIYVLFVVMQMLSTIINEAIKFVF